MSDLNQAQRLNPAQQQVTDELGAKPQDRPRFRDDLRDHLRADLEAGLRPHLDRAHKPPLFLSKRGLSLLHGCQSRFLAESETDFAWSVPMARGTVAHKAIELMVAWRGNPTPLELVDEALARFEQDERGVGGFISSLGEGERAELVSSANDFVATFMETFPPIQRRWVPVSESRVRADLCDDRLTLQGRVDLSLGKADGNTAGKVLIDFKTGRPSPSHIEDLRFYALLEALKVGIPPRLLVNYYLEAGEPRSEEVTEDLLWSTVRRVTDAVGILVSITGPEAQSPSTSPSPTCRFCPALDSCDDGTQHLESIEDDF